MSHAPTPATGTPATTVKSISPKGFISFGATIIIILCLVWWFQDAKREHLAKEPEGGYSYAPPAPAQKEKPEVKYEIRTLKGITPCYLSIDFAIGFGSRTDSLGTGRGGNLWVWYPGEKDPVLFDSSKKDGGIVVPDKHTRKSGKTRFQSMDSLNTKDWVFIKYQSQI